MSPKKKNLQNTTNQPPSSTIQPIPPCKHLYPPIFFIFFAFFYLFSPIFAYSLSIFTYFLLIYPYFYLFSPYFCLFSPYFLPIFAYFTMKNLDKIPINPRRPDGPRAAAPCFGRFIDCFGRAKGAAYGRAAAVRSGCGKVGGGVAVAGSGWVAVDLLESAWLSDHFECLNSRIGAELSEF
jgi:hypothetical protein